MLLLRRRISHGSGPLKKHHHTEPFQWDLQEEGFSWLIKANLEDGNRAKCYNCWMQKSGQEKPQPLVQGPPQHTSRYNFQECWIGCKLWNPSILRVNTNQRKWKRRRHGQWCSESAEFCRRCQHTYHRAISWMSAERTFQFTNRSYTNCRRRNSASILCRSKCKLSSNWCSNLQLGSSSQSFLCYNQQSRCISQ